MYRKAVARIVGRRPRLEDRGPAQRAPINPPRVNMEEMVAKATSAMGMQLGSEELVAAFSEVEARDRISHRAATVQMESLRHVITS
jgi:hypothetical protein